MENKVVEAIIGRRSIREYKSDPVPKEVLDTVIKAGLYAPSGMNRQSAVIVAVTDKDLIAKLSEMNRAIGGFPEGRDPFYGAPAVLIVLAKTDIPTMVYDGSLVMGNLMLAASALGLGSCWIHRAKEEFETEEGKRILKELGIEGEYEGIGHCILGYPAKDIPEAAPREENRVYYI